MHVMGQDDTAREALSASLRTLSLCANAAAFDPLEHKDWCERRLGKVVRVKVSQPEARGAYLKKHTTFLVTEECFNYRVRRRFSDFEWLHAVLRARYSGLLVPSLPEKNAIKTDAFIQNRMRGLQLFLEHVMSSAYLRADAAVASFFMANNDEDWEQAKKSNAVMDNAGAGHLRWMKLVFAQQFDHSIDERIQAFQQHVEQTEKVLAELNTVTKRFVDRSAAIVANIDALHGLFNGWKIVELASADAPQPRLCDLLTRSTVAIGDWHEVVKAQGCMYELVLHEQVKYMHQQARDMLAMLNVREAALVASRPVDEPSRPSVTSGETTNSGFSLTASALSLALKIRTATEPSAVDQQAARERAAHLARMITGALVGEEMARFRNNSESLLEEAMDQFACGQAQMMAKSEKASTHEQTPLTPQSSIVMTQQVTMEVVWWDEDDQSENHCRRTFCQIPFSAIYEQADRGKRSLLRLVEFFRRKAHGERLASEELRLLLRQQSVDLTGLEDLEEHGTSIRRALMEVRHYVEAACTQQLLLAKVLEEQVAEPLVSLQAASEVYIRTLQDEIRHVNDDYMQALNALKQATARLRKAGEDLQEAQERQRIALHGIGIPEFELQRLAVRVNKCNEERKSAEAAKQSAKEVLYNRIIARDEMAMAVSVAYQKAEEERLDQLNSCLKRFLHVEKERLNASQNMIEGLSTHIDGINRSEDIQLLIHNRRNPDNMHFQGKALALLDWHWAKMQSADRSGSKLKRKKDSFEMDFDEETTDDKTATREPLSASSDRDNVRALEIMVPPPSHSSDKSSPELLVSIPSPASKTQKPKSPHRALAQTSMGRALHKFFEADCHATAAVANVDLPISPTGAKVEQMEQKIRELGVETGQDTKPPTTVQSGDNSTGSDVVAAVTNPLNVEDDSCTVIKTQCKDHAGRAMFVRCLNRQRSLDTKVKDHASFHALVDCFNVFLNECIREDDVKAAKTAMILAETFYLPREAAPSSTSDAKVAEDHHPVGKPLDRGAARIYLQVEVKKHAIWKNPTFWEKALLLAIGEELQKTPQPCAWEDLPTAQIQNSEDQHQQHPPHHHHSSLHTREEAVSRVHNIVFGQLGSFTLSMLEFDVPLQQIQSFVETMCDAHELTEDQRFLLRKNLQEIFTTLRHDAAA
ncbi:TPA: hypothetical protein N0F65_000606 [Lagenidium giganteum]|uniref:PX domain-containing protein n=1 Tax=Lagenidium giganteum TaxID=4803 RepID=A0AAV2YNN7_9STRA|nr:TPA: hypothetical protein N0F65_000606 [Lagenidium giganteum]